MGNWSWVEVIWTLIAIGGMYFSFRNILDGRTDLKALRQPNGSSAIEIMILKVIAWGTIRRDSIREAVQFLFMGIGIWAGITPNNPNPSAAGIFAGFVFIFASGLLTAQAFFDRRERATLKALGIQLEIEQKE